jgi:hypothetical protein
MENASLEYCNKYSLKTVQLLSHRIYNSERSCQSYHSFCSVGSIHIPKTIAQVAVKINYIETIIVVNQLFAYLKACWH